MPSPGNRAVDRSVMPVVEVALKRQSYGIKPITDSVVADQQQVADTFFAPACCRSQSCPDVARRSGS
jgi:sulfonate transport system substrate-binding protein